MASVYTKNNKIYISWYDPFTGKNKNKSTKLSNTKQNRKKAQVIATELQKKINESYEKFKQIGIIKNTIGSAIDHFLKVNSDKHFKTIQGYKNFFSKFVTKFPEYEPCLLINKLTCEEWLLSFRKSRYQPNTLHGITKILKKFLNFLFEYNYVPVFKLNRDVTYKPEVKDIIVFQENDLKNMIDSLKDKNDNFKTAFYLLLYTGLRPSDIYNIKVDDIDLNKGTIKYFSEKTKEYFEVPFHPELKPILDERIKQIQEGKILEYETINNLGKAFRRFLAKLKLQHKGYTLRTFRKTFITLAHQSGMDLATVSKLAGHKKITTTELYYNRLSISKQSSELKKFKLPI